MESGAAGPGEGVLVRGSAVWVHTCVPVCAGPACRLVQVGVCFCG